MPITLSFLNKPRQVFLAVLLLTTLLKVWLAAAIPLTGDEAYFYQWGKHLDWGYYDHPPVGGWLLALMQTLSSAVLVLRLPAILLWIAVTFGMIDCLRRLQPNAGDKTWWMASLFLLMPFTWSLNLVTTDTPLIFFLFFSGYAFLRGELDRDLRWHVACGALLGLALLSKYFAGLIAIAYAVYFIFIVRSRRGTLSLFLIALCTLPFVAINILYNATHCWNNILFNLVNRNQHSHFSLSQTALYGAMLLYLVTPWLGWQVLRARRWRDHWLLANLFVLPFGIFLVLSFYKVIGLHWVLAFLPFVFLFAACVIDDAAMFKKMCRYTLWLGLPHLVALCLLIFLPNSVWQHTKLHASIVMHKETPRLITILKAGLPDDAVLMTRSYSQSALLAYYLQTDVPLFGAGSFHARMDDELTDFRPFEGRTMRIVDTRPIPQEELAPFFENVSVSIVSVDGAKFWVATGQGFQFQAYFNTVLTKTAQDFYRIPAWLPTHGCAFLDRYALWPAKPI